MPDALRHVAVADHYTFGEREHVALRMPACTVARRTPTPTSATAQVAAYLAQNFRIVTWPGTGDAKGPTTKGWPQKVYTLADYHDGMRVGLLLGHELAPGRFLHDADIDWAPGSRIAEMMLLATAFVYGHSTKPISHCMSTLPTALPSEAFKDPIDKVMLIELRGTNKDGTLGHQSMAPPSIWSKDGHREPLTFVYPNPTVTHHVDAAAYRYRVVLAAIGMLLARRLGHNGFGHDARLAWAGFLLRANVAVADLVTMGEAMSVVCNNLEVRDVRTAVESTAANLQDAAKKVTGGPALAAMLGTDGPAVIRRINEWLGRSDEAITRDDFHAYMPMHNYLFIPTREFWPARSVDARVPAIPTGALDDDDGEPDTIPAHVWLDRHRPVEQLTWAPGHPMVVRDQLVADGGWIARPGCSTLNLYRPPSIVRGNPGLAGPWLDLLRKVYPDDAEHLLAWFAHRVQHPGVKINHALVLGGAPGIGKDSILEPVKSAIGPWNFAEVSPKQMLGRFNGFTKSVILRVSEVRDLGDVSRYDFYDHAKIHEAAPPDVVRVDEKNIREHAVFNVTGVVYTTNHETDGMFLPADDRRHFVTWSKLTPDDFEVGYWKQLYAWYDDDEGRAHVAAYLADYSLTTFNPKAPPPKTPAFWAIVDANRSGEDAELADVLDVMGNPVAVTIRQIAARCKDTDLVTWLTERRNSRSIPHRLKAVGYEAFRNAGDRGGLWKIEGKRQVIYVQVHLTVPERERAARAIVDAARGPLFGGKGGGG